MSEHTTPGAATARPAKRRGRRWVTPLLLAAVVAIFAVCFALAPKAGASEGEAFGGTDSKVTDILSEHGVEPWAHPLFEPGSSEVESGLFALQAALGAGLFGFAIGSLRGRKAERDRLQMAQGTAAVESSTGTALTTGTSRTGTTASPQD